MMIAGHRFDRVGFVEHDDVVVRQDAGPLLPQGQIAEEQRMIDDQHLGILRPPPGAVVKAILVRRAVAAHAIAVVAGHLVPHRRQRAKLQIGQAAVAGCFRPFDQLANLRRTLPARGTSWLARPRRFPFAAGSDSCSRPLTSTAVNSCGMTLCNSGRSLWISCSWSVIVCVETTIAGPCRLFIARRSSRLRRFVGGADRLACRLADRGEDGGHQIGEALADARARLDDQMPPPADRLGDRLGHLHLLRPLFIARREPSGNAGRGPKISPGESMTWVSITSGTSISCCAPEYRESALGEVESSAGASGSTRLAIIRPRSLIFARSVLRAMPSCWLAST